MATALDLSGIQPFNPLEDPTSLASKWDAWIKRFNRFVVGMDVKDPTRKRALLLYLAGPEVERIFETLPETGEDKEYDIAVQKLTAYFSPKKNTLYEIHLFRQARQRPDETMDQFYTRLRQLAKTCEFTDADKEIKIQLVQQCQSSRVRKKALRDNPSLDDLLSFARSIELSDKQAAILETQRSPEEKIYFAQTQPGRIPSKSLPRGPPPLHDRGISRTKFCYRCGGPFPHQDPRSCPAINKRCNACGRPGHFDRVCRSKQQAPFLKQSQSPKRVNNIESVHQPFDVPESRNVKYVDADSSESEDDCYSFALSSAAKKKLPIAKLVLAGMPVDFLVDSGATVNVLDACDFKRLCTQPGGPITLKKTSSRLFAFGSHQPLLLQGKFDALIESRQRVAIATFYVTKKSSGNTSLLSFGTSEELGLVTLTLNSLGQHAAVTENSPCTQPQPSMTDRSKISQVKQARLRDNYPAVFDGIGKLEGHEQKLHVDPSVPPVSQTFRRTPFHLRKQLDSWLEESLCKGIIEPVQDESTDWVSGLVVAPKPHNPNEIRVCGDYRRVNVAIKRERHPIPTVDELFESMTGAVVFSKVDLKAGYHQIPLDTQSRQLTTFTSHKGLFRYKRLPFGICSASEVFQNAIEGALRGLDGVRNIADDIIVWGSTEQEHDDRVDALFKRLTEKGLTVNPDKCLFNQDSLWFYGYILTKDGLRADPSKIAAINNTKEPKTVGELRSFLGLANYCSRFIPDYSTLTAPLRALTSQGAQYVWTEEHARSFQKVKDAIAHDCTMAFYNPTHQTILTVDASPVGLGAILSTVDANGNQRNVAFASRSLTPVEQRYSQTEREALAVVWGCEKFHMYLIGTRFTLYTDHKALEVIFSPKSKPPARIERWALRLQQYEYDVKYRKGDDNPADVLSRMPLPHTCTKPSVADEYVNFLAGHSVPKSMTLTEIQEFTSNDPELQAVSQHVTSGAWERGSPYYMVRQELAVTPEGVVLRGHRIVMPTALRERTLSLAHQGHQGIVKTKQHLRTKVWWPHMDRDVDDWIKRCLPCQVSGHGDPPTPLQVSPLPSKPWSSLYMDFCGPFPTGETLLVVIDGYSKFPEVEVMHSTQAKSVIRQLDKMFARHGFPDKVTSDNGPPFNSEELKKYMEHHAILHHRITPLWPQANGEVESFMKPLGKAIRTAKTERRDWKDELPRFLLNYRTTPHTSTGVAPCHLLFNREIRAAIPSYSSVTSGDHSTFHQQARDNDQKRKATMKSYTDSKRHATPSQIQVGDTVLVKQPKLNKFTTQFDSTPLTVVAVNGSLVTAERPNKRVTRNSSHFKLFHGKVTHEDSSEDPSNSEEELDDDDMERIPVGLPAEPPRRYPARRRVRPRYFIQDT